MSKSAAADTERPTPYETGMRLEPRPWVRSAEPAPMPRETTTGLTTADDFGWCDFDDAPGRTVLSLYIERRETGYVLHIDNMTEEALTISGDTEATVLGIEHRAGLAELIELAERGRQAYLHEADRGEHTESDQDAAVLRWVNAHNAAVAIRHQMQAH